MSTSSRTGRILVGLVCCTFVAHLSEAGTRWARTIGGPSEDCMRSVQGVSDGGYILAGYTRSSGAGHYDAWSAKLDSSGNVSWQKTYGGASGDYAKAIQATSDGGYFFTGNTESFGAGSYDAWCVKLDSSGGVMWQKAYGGASGDQAYAVQATSDGGYILAGHTLSFGAGSYDAWCVKLDASGNVLWQKTYGGASYDDLCAVQTTSDGGYILAGSTSSFGAGSCDAWSVKLDSSGGVLWQKTYGGAFADYAEVVQVTSDGAYILAGRTGSFGAGTYDSWCVKLDSSGNAMWQKTLGGASDDDSCAVQATNDGGYILAGYTDSFGAGSHEAWCLRLSSTGDIDPSCANLVSSSSASTGVSTAVPAVSAGAVTATAVVGSLTSAPGTSSTAATAVLCSGGTEGPFISSIASKTGKPGSTATIKGTGFSTDKKKNVVFFGTSKVKSIKKAKATSLRITIPGVKKGTIGVHVVVNGETSNTVQFQVK